MLLVLEYVNDPNEIWTLLKLAPVFPMLTWGVYVSSSAPALPPA